MFVDPYFEKISLDEISNSQIENLSEQVLLGPQKEILEKVEDFNFRYRSDIGVTKTFRWSPGIYDKIRKAYTGLLGWEVRTSKISTFLNKIDQSSWRYRNFKTELNQLQDMLDHLRSSNAQFQDNSDIVMEKFKFVKDKVIEELSNCGSDTIHIDAFIDKNDLENNTPLLYVLCTVDKGHEINVTIANDTSSQPVNQPIQLEWPIQVCFQIPVVKWINVLCNNPLDSITQMANSRYRQSGNYVSRIGSWDSYSVKARYCVDNNRRLLHPYMSRNTRNRTNWEYICEGELQSDMRIALLQLDFTSFFYHFNKWMSTYVVNKTAPMNDISLLFYGRPSNFDERFLTIVRNHNSAESCTYPSDYKEIGSNIKLEDVYCNKMNCSLKNDCSFYKENFDESFQHKREAVIMEISEIGNDEIVDLMLNDTNFEDTYEFLDKHKENSRLISYMIFFKDMLNEKEEWMHENGCLPFKGNPATIINSCNHLEYMWNQHFGNGRFKELLIDDLKLYEDDLIATSISFIEQEILYVESEDYTLSYKDLNIDFDKANEYFKWVRPREKKKDSNSSNTPDLKKFTAVGHGEGWFEDEDGVWKKVPF